MNTWSVIDTEGTKPGERCPVLGQFNGHDEAAAFIATLPDPESGRYGIDPPEEDQ